MKYINTCLRQLCVLSLLLLVLTTTVLANHLPIEMPKAYPSNCNSNPNFGKTLRSLAQPLRYSVAPATNGGVFLSNGATVVINKGITVGIRIPTLPKSKTQNEIELDMRQSSARIQGNTLLFSNKVQSIGVTDLTGRMVLAATNSNRLTLDLPQGTYILRYVDNGSRITNRLIML